MARIRTTNLLFAVDSKEENGFHLIRAADTPSFSYGEEAALPPI